MKRGEQVICLHEDSNRRLYRGNIYEVTENLHEEQHIYVDVGYGWQAKLDGSQYLFISSLTNEDIKTMRRRVLQGEFPA